MLRTLKVYSRADINSVSVAWLTNCRRRGIVNCCGISSGEPLLIAELMAIKHVLFERKVFGEIFSGTNIEIVTENDELKRMVEMQSEKVDAFPFARYMSRALHGISIRLGITDIHNQWKVQNILNESIDFKDFDGNVYHQLGRDGERLSISRHAAESYGLLLEDETHAVKNSYKSLVFLLRKVKFMKKVSSNDGKSTVEIWGHQDSPYRFILKRKNDHLVLISVDARTYKSQCAHLSAKSCPQ